MQLRSELMNEPVRRGLNVTHSEIKRNLEERLDQPTLTVLAMLMSTKDLLNKALAGDTDDFEDQSEADYLRETMLSLRCKDAENLTVEKLGEIFATLQAIKIDNKRKAKLHKIFSAHMARNRPAAEKIQPQNEEGLFRWNKAQLQLEGKSGAEAKEEYEEMIN